MNFTLTCVILATLFGTFFQFGYHNGVINQPLEFISEFISNVSEARHGTTTGVPLTLLTSFCVSSYLIGGLIGGLVGGILSKNIGRRWSIIILSVPCLGGCVLLVTCKLARSYEMIIVGRLLIGLACGAYTAIGPAYLSEIAPPAMRGAAGALLQLMGVFALLLSQVLGLKQLLNTEQLWPLLLGLNAVPCILSVFYLFFAPESPRYLYLIRNDEHSARAVLIRLGRTPEEVQAELDDMARESRASTERMSLTNFFRTPYLRWALLVALICQIGQQFSGINGLLYYSSELFRGNGMSDDNVIYMTMGLGIVLLLTTLISTCVIEKFGRRILLIGGLLIALGSLIIFTVCLSVGSATNLRWLTIGAFVAIYLFIIGFGIGPGSIPWFVVSEMFTQESKDIAISFSVMVNWSCNIIVGLVFLQLLASIGIYSFVPFIVIIIFVVLFLYAYLPETKGQSPTTIQAYFQRQAQGRTALQYQILENDLRTSATDPDESIANERPV